MLVLESMKLWAATFSLVEPKKMRGPLLSGISQILGTKKNTERKRAVGN
jgi:hypothetical protein